MRSCQTSAALKMSLSRFAAYAARSNVRTVCSSASLHEKMRMPHVVPGQPEFTLTQEEHDFFFPTLGNRDVVGYGLNGSDEYVDEPGFPCPAIRFKANTPEILALQEKEKGDWRHLSIEEKKALYRHNFCKTYIEMTATPADWRSLIGGLAVFLGVTLLTQTILLKKLYHGYGKDSLINPDAYDRKYMATQMKMLVLCHSEPCTGPGGRYDYEKDEWKKRSDWE